MGRGDVPIGQVMRALYPDLPTEDIQEPKPTVFGRVIDRIRLGRGIKIQGVDGLMVRYAQCCQPVPGDSVVGYVTQGRGISIHRADCPNLLTLANDERRVDIDWQETAGEAFAVRLAVTGEDRRGLYADIMESVSQTGHQHPRRRPAHQGRHRLRNHLRRGGQPAAPGQGHEGGSEGEGCDGNRAEGCAGELGYRLLG